VLMSRRRSLRVTVLACGAYPEQLGSRLRLEVANAACPGETSASFINPAAQRWGWRSAGAAGSRSFRASRGTSATRTTGRATSAQNTENATGGRAARHAQRSCTAAGRRSPRIWPRAGRGTGRALRSIPGAQTAESVGLPVTPRGRTRRKWPALREALAAGPRTGRRVRGGTELGAGRGAEMMIGPSRVTTRLAAGAPR
jgi:hypothetical protein